MSLFSQFSRSKLCTPLRGGRQATLYVAKMQKSDMVKWVNYMAKNTSLLPGMPDIDYSALNAHIKDAATYRAQEMLEKINVRPSYLDAIQEHNDAVEEERLI